MSEFRRYTPDKVEQLLCEGPRTAWVWQYEICRTEVFAGRSELVIDRPGLVLGSQKDVLGLGSAGKYYNGLVYLQEGPTCGAWALANGLKTFGITPPVEMMMELLNEANVEYRGKEQGLEFDFLTQETKKYGFRNFSLRNLRRKLGEQTIKEAIDGEKALLVLVNPRYWKPGATDPFFSVPHYVCIAGYNYRDTGFKDMEALVMDSCDIGKVWLPVPYLSEIAISYPRELRSFQGIQSRDWIVS